MVYAIQLAGGLVTASILFLLAAGLSLIFGVCRILNLAHGAFYMLALYFGYTANNLFGGGSAAFLLSLVLVPLLLAGIGWGAERLLFRPIYGRDVLIQVLPTIAIIYIVQDIVRAGWGFYPKSVPVPSFLAGPVRFLGLIFPAYYVFITGAGLAVGIFLWLLINRTDLGLLIRATARDRKMASALGVDDSAIHAWVFAISLALVGFAGVLYAPIGGATPLVVLDATTDAFAVVVIGGLGSIGGAAIASVLIGLVKSFGIVVLPQLSVTLVFILMVIVLLLRPNGLMGERE